jgi:SpoVK/Ycf46/Vps4 family AAA+-type ATPase
METKEAKYTFDDYKRDVQRLLSGIGIDPELEARVRRHAQQFQSDPRYHEFMQSQQKRISSQRTKPAGNATQATAATTQEQQRQTSFVCKPSYFNRSRRFSSIAGMNREKQELLKTIILPYRYQQLFPAGKGVLFYSLPGVGKTFLANHVASEMHHQLLEDLGVTDAQLAQRTSVPLVNFFAVSAADLKGIYTGQTEKNIRALFECAQESAEATDREISRVFSLQQSPWNRSVSIVFLDEIDALGSKRGGAGSGSTTDASSSAALTSLLQELSNETYDRVKVIGATNRPWDLDSALLSRFPLRLFVDLPSDMTRLQILCQRIHRLVSTSTCSADELLYCLLVPLTGAKKGAARLLAKLSSVDEKFWSQWLARSGRKEFDVGSSAAFSCKNKLSASTLSSFSNDADVLGYSNRDLDSLADSVLQAAAARLLVSRRKKTTAGFVVCDDEEAEKNPELCNCQLECGSSSDQQPCQRCGLSSAERSALRLEPKDITVSDILQAMSIVHSSVDPTEYAKLVRYSLQ